MENFKQYFESELNSKFDNSLRIVDSLVKRYMNLIFENSSSERIIEEYAGLELNDINENLTLLKYQIDFLERLGAKNTIPCLAVGELKIPIDVFHYLDSEKRLSLGLNYADFDYYRPYFLDQRLDIFLNSIEKSSNKIVTNQSLEFVNNYLKNALTNFIEMRYESFFNENIFRRISNFFRNDSSPPVVSHGPGSTYLTIKLSTRNHGLDIEASPAYFVRWKKFGSPTSPISGYLIPGTYIFGGSGVGLPTFTSDSTPVDIPPNFDIKITKF